MICSVIPLKRMPKQILEFDYLVPKELEDQIKPGQLVKVPMRRGTIFGLVYKLADTSSVESSLLKPLDSIVNITPLLEPAFMHFARIASRWYGVASGTMTNLTTIPLQPNKLKKMELVDLPMFKKEDPSKPSFSVYKSIDEAKEIFLNKIKDSKGQILILSPQKSSVERLVALLEGCGKNVIQWDASAGNKEKFDKWLQIRNGEANVVIGTRAAVLLPFYSLSSIFVDESHSDYHKSSEQAPRFHVKDICHLRNQIWGTPYELTGYSPTLSHKFCDPQSDIPKLISDPVVVDMRSQGGSFEYSPLSITLKDTLINSEGNTLLILGRKGYATSYSCQDCGFVFSCHSCKVPFVYYESTNELKCNYCPRTIKIESSCPKCESQMIKLRGFGTELVEKEVKNLDENKQWNILRADSDKINLENFDDSKKNVVIGTNLALNRVNWSQIDNICFVDIDRQLALPAYHAAMDLWHTINFVDFYKKKGSKLILQTHNPENEIFSYLTRPNEWYEREVSLRKSLSYPPANYLIRFIFAHKDEKKVQEETKKMHAFIDNLLNSNQKVPDYLTETLKCAILSDPYALYPSKIRGTYHQAILLKLPETGWENILIWITRFFPQGWKIDPNPQTLISM